MEVVVAVRLSTNSRALHKKANVELVRHADAAVHLYAFLGGVLYHFGALRFRHAGEDGAFVTVRIECLQCCQYGRLTDLNFGKELRGTMLKPGGTFMFANFAQDIGVDGYMESCMNWALLLRSEADMWNIVNASTDRNAVKANIFFGDNRNIVYAVIETPA